MRSRTRPVDALEKAGQPVVRIAVPDIYDVGQEFFRWEIATAVAGSVIGINAFNQPDVEASKIETRKLTDEYEKKGSLPPESPLFRGRTASSSSRTTKNSAALKQAVGSDVTSRWLSARASESPSSRAIILPFSATSR